MGNASKNTNTRIFTLNELSLRLSPALADEIGLNESIMLLQIEYWISISDHSFDDHRWTYQSVRQMQEKAFAFWSIATISRTAKSLLDKGLIIEGNYNKKTYDNTRWFALNYKELSKLTSIMIRGYGSETPPFQNETPLFQNETTIPQITPQITPQNYLAAAAAADSAHAREDDSCDMGRLESDAISDAINDSSPTSTDKVMGLKAIEFAEVNLKRELSKYERDKLINWCTMFRSFPDCHDPESIVIAGLERCVIKNDLSSLIAYLNPILEDYLKNNIRTLEQVYIMYQKRKNAQKAPPLQKENSYTSAVVGKEDKGAVPGKYENFYL